VTLDTHVHTFHSGRSTIYPLHRLLRESYNTPEMVYRLAKERGMDLVTITDHDEISAALALSQRPDVVVGCEVTGVFPDDGVRVHLNVFGLRQEHHREIQRLRKDLRELLPYLRSEQLFSSLNHVASGINGQITSAHLAALLPWVPALEVNNGSRLPVQNRTAQCLAEACAKIGIAGSDAHTGRGVGRTWTEVPDARTRDEFMRGLAAGHVTVGGRMGSVAAISSDVLRFTGNFLRDQLATVVERPLHWKGHAGVLGGVFGLPLVPLALAAGYFHFVREERFNENLLFDIVARRGALTASLPALAA
jgi:predicted metal-dependent phosphoesterase TrpH